MGRVKFTLICALTCGLLAGANGQVEPSTNFVFKLSDKRSMRIKRIAFGTTNVLRIDREGRVHRVDPAKLGKQFKGEEDHLTIWNTFWPDRKPHHQRRTIEGDGYKSSFGTFGTHTVNDRKFFFVRTEDFPRGARELIYRGLVDDTEFAFRLPNPHPPIPSPAEMESEFEFSLKFLRDRKTSSFNDSGLAIAAMRDGKDHAHWFDFKHVLLDENGNVSHRQPGASFRGELEIAAYRNQNHHWKPEEYITLKPTVPRPGKVQVYPINRIVNGVKVHYALVGGPGYFVVSNGVVRVQKPVGKRKEYTATKSNGNRRLVIRQTTHMPHWTIVVTEGDQDTRHGPRAMTLMEVPSPGDMRQADFVAGSGPTLRTHEFRLRSDRPEEGYELRLAPQQPQIVKLALDPKKIKFGRLDFRNPMGPLALKLSDEQQIYVERVAFGTNKLIQINNYGEMVEVQGAEIDRRFLGEPNELRIWSVVTGRGYWQDVKVHFDSGESFKLETGTPDPWIGGVNYSCFRTQSFPRRQKEMKITGRFGDKPFELKVPNPLHPLGELPPLTAKRPRNDGYEFRLGRVAISPEHWGTVASADVFVSSNGVAMNRYFTQKTTFSDITGNRGPALSTNESPWKVETKFYRKPEAPWPTNAFIPIKLRRLPGPGEVDYYEVNRESNGLKVVGVAVGGAGSFIISNQAIIKAERFTAGMRSRHFVSHSKSKGWKIDRTTDESAWVTILSEGAPRDVRITTFLQNSDGTRVELKTRSGTVNLSVPLRSHHGSFDPAQAGGDCVIGIAAQLPIRSEFLIDPKEHLRPPMVMPPEAMEELLKRVRARKSRR